MLHCMYNIFISMLFVKKNDLVSKVQTNKKFKIQGFSLQLTNIGTITLLDLDIRNIQLLTESAGA